MNADAYQSFKSTAPLFECSLPLCFSKEAATKKKLELILRESFKNLWELAKIADTRFLGDLMGYNLKDRSAFIQYVSEKNEKIEKTVKDTPQITTLTRR